MIYALDTEFIEDGHTIELISIGLVAADGRTYYRQNLDCDFFKANEWVMNHVYLHLEDFAWHPENEDLIPYTLFMSEVWKSPQTLRYEIQDFVGESPMFVGYYSAYDWVVVCQLFGTMMQLPKTWPMYCHDLRAMLDWQGLTHVTQPDDMPHHALSDARWIMETYKHYCCHEGQGDQ